MHTHDFTAFTQCAFDFIRQCCHIHFSSAVNAGNAFRTQTFRTSGTVHGYIAAANDNHTFFSKVWQSTVTNAAQHLYRRHNATFVFPFDTNLFITLGTNGNINTVKSIFDLRQGHIFAHFHTCMYGNTCGKNCFQILIQSFSWQTIAWNAITEHTTQFFILFKYFYMMSHQCQIISRAQTAGTAAQNGNFLSCWFCTRRCRHNACMIHSIPFQRTNIDGIIHHISAAPCFTGMFTNHSTGRYKGIVFSNEPYRIRITFMGNQGNISGNIHICRTESHTGHRLVNIEQTAFVMNMFQIIIPEP